MSVTSDSNGTHDPVARDAALIARIQAGDEEAFCDLHAVYAVPLVRYAMTVLGDRDAAEDVVQDLFMAIWERRTAWRPKGSVMAYLYRGTRNRVLDVLSHQQVVARVADAGRHDPSAFVPIPLSAAQTLEAAEQSLALAQAIAALPERRRVALLLRAVHGAEYSCIAETLGVTEQAARILVARARETLSSVRESR